MTSQWCCLRCGRPLKDPDSRRLGLGPTCRQKVSAADLDAAAARRHRLESLFELDTEDALMEYEFHPLADAYPLMEGQPFDEFVEDVRENGLLEPIVLYDGQILDGRNRYRACRAAGVDPRFEAYCGQNPDVYVASKNEHRRHLTEEQLHAAREKRRVRALELRQQGRSYRQIGEDLGVSQTQARKDVLKSGVNRFTPETVTGADGKTYAATAPQPDEEASPSGVTRVTPESGTTADGKIQAATPNRRADESGVNRFTPEMAEADRRIVEPEAGEVLPETPGIAAPDAIAETPVVSTVASRRHRPRSLADPAFSVLRMLHENVAAAENEVEQVIWRDLEKFAERATVKMLAEVLDALDQQDAWEEARRRLADVELDDGAAVSRALVGHYLALYGKRRVA